MPTLSGKIDEKVRLRGEREKKQVMLYLGITLYGRFKKICAEKGFSLSMVVEEIIREYVESAEAESASETEKK